jgi:sulfur-oxidizing protein SoxY
MKTVRILLLMALNAVSMPAVWAQAQSPSSGAWQYLRGQFYGSRDIGEVDENLMSIQAPANTPDPSATPITVRFGDAAAGKVKQLRLIIDNNPSPLAATMNLEPGVPVDELDMRVRIDRFTSVRAIAEMNDGSLEMRSAWVNASGGCSAPPSAASGGTLGEIRLRAANDDKTLQMSIRHPNNSGFQIDPVSGDAIPPHYISHIRLSAGSKTVLDADTGISLSENPTLRIASEQPLPAPLEFVATDSKDGHFSGTWTGPGSK